jgi:cyclic pyranopterin phosphate synthase
MPPEGITLKSHKDTISYEEIFETAKQAVNLGITKIRITGGEPLVRKGIVNLVEMIASLSLKDFAMTTNGILLKKYAKQLKKAGLHRVNISLDAVNPKRYKEITRCGNIEQVLEGIEAAKQAGLTPIKINTVIEKSKLEPDALEVTEFANKNNLQIRYIRKMDLNKGKFWIVDGGTGGHCPTCSRIRLTSDGTIYPCLFSDLGYNIRKLGIKNAILKAVENKPEKGILSKNNTFYNLGG